MSPARLTYRQIADDLADRIRSGEYPAGSKLPSYSEIARMYSCSVTTAQAAMRVLSAMNLTRGQAGVGVFVVDDLDS